MARIEESNVKNLPYTDLLPRSCHLQQAEADHDSIVIDRFVRTSLSGPEERAIHSNPSGAPPLDIHGVSIGNASVSIPKLASLLSAGVLNADELRMTVAGRGIDKSAMSKSALASPPPPAPRPSVSSVSLKLSGGMTPVLSASVQAGLMPSKDVAGG